ncbi:hypothetical protein ACIBKX_31555 [Streptomyces sp. NPDC050658]
MPGTAGDQHVAPTGGSPWGQPWGPGPADPPGVGQAWGTAPDQQHQQHQHQPQPYGDQQHQHQPYGDQPQQHQQHQSHGAGAPLPAEGMPQPQQGGVQPYGSQQQPAAPAYQQPAAPAQQPPADATYGGQLPPVAEPGQLPAGTPAAAPLPPAAPLPQAAAGDADATQYIPPVAPGALPPEAPADQGTQVLGRVSAPLPEASGPGAPGAPAAPGAMPAAAPAAPNPDAEATQYIAPVPAAPGTAPFGIRPGAPGDRQPPAEFDSLFRTEQPESDAGSTQQMPRFEAPQPAPGHGHGHGQGDGGGRAARRAAAAPAGRGGGRTGSKVPLFAAAGVVIALLGVGAGALLSGGGGDDDEADPKTVSESAPAEEKPSPSVDPAKEQAVALDKLLADSNNSRASVITAVRNVGKCANLAQSATDLRNAAKQRNGLVTRLSTLSVDKLPANAQLTASLNKAWKASASADNHYAAWAGQVAGKKGCKKGHARTTSHTIAANKASGEATTAKTEASRLWNAIATKYGLTTRDKSQL